MLFEEVFGKSNELSANNLRTVRAEHHLLNLAAECLDEELGSKAATYHLDLRVILVDSLDQFNQLRHPRDIEVVDRPTTAREDNDFELLELFVSWKLTLVSDVALPYLLTNEHELAHKKCLVDVLPVMSIVL